MCSTDQKGEFTDKLIDYTPNKLFKYILMKIMGNSCSPSIWIMNSRIAWSAIRHLPSWLQFHFCLPNAFWKTILYPDIVTRIFHSFDQKKKDSYFLGLKLNALHSTYPSFSSFFLASWLMHQKIKKLKKNKVGEVLCS